MLRAVCVTGKGWGKRGHLGTLQASAALFLGCCLASVLSWPGTATPEFEKQRNQQKRSLLRRKADIYHFNPYDFTYLRGKDGAAIDAGLPSGWTQFHDPLTKEFYYFNNQTGVSTWDLPQPDSISALPFCTADMIKSSYTRCDPVTSSRSLAFFHSSQCKGGVPLPPTVMGLPCNSSCDPGQYLPLGKANCEPCAAGTYSVGGGSLFSNWERLPVGMTTYCRFQLEADKRQPCSAWILNGTYIYSGHMRGKRLVDSILEYKVEMIRAGSVTFEFKVDAERRWDGLYFIVDGERKMPMVSYQFKYTAFTVALNVGFHTLQWVYHKDVAYEMGEDMAWIRSIEVLGTQANVDYCNVCPAGQYSERGAVLCTKCPTNTFAAKSGSATCAPCNPPGVLDRPHMYSYPGAAACSPSAPCVQEDITASYGDCDDATGKRTKTYSYTQPQICHGGVALPPDEQVSCAPCDPGMYREGSECSYCPSGTFNPNATTEGIRVCTTCAPGSIAKKVKYFDKAFEQEHFQRLVDDGDLSTGCANGFCGTNGWRPVGDKIDTGVGNGEVADIWLALEVQLETDGEVSFEFSRRASNSENRLQMFVDDRRMWGLETLQAVSDNDQILRYSAAVPAGDHVITWVFHKEREYSWLGEEATSQAQGEDRAVIEEILVTGVAVGGAVQCTQCEAGYYSDTVASACRPCPPGHYAGAAGQAACAPCEAGSFAAGYGATACRQCGHGTFRGAGAESCGVSPTQCRYSVSDDLTYDLSGLARPDGPMWGPVVDANKSMSYYVNVCTQDRSNTTCLGREGVGISAFACQQATIADEMHDNYLATSLGDVMAFYTLDDDVREGLVVSFQDGAECSNGVRRSINITLRCDRNAGPGEPELFPGESAEEDKCRYHLLWRSQYACPQCTESDMDAIPGECSLTGQRPVNMAWREPKRCFGGLSLPPVRYEDCVAVVLDKGKVAVIVMSSGAVFVVLCVALIWLYVRNRKIYREYSVLKEQNEADMELERYTLDEEDA